MNLDGKDRISIVFSAPSAWNTAGTGCHQDSERTYLHQPPYLHVYLLLLFPVHWNDASGKNIKMAMPQKYFSLFSYFLNTHLIPPKK